MTAGAGQVRRDASLLPPVPRRPDLCLRTQGPYLDHRLVEYMWNVPWALKNADGSGKSILRAGRAAAQLGGGPSRRSAAPGGDRRRARRAPAR
ncbi:asparagine synthase-related protein [Kitasatospora purpeofusca]|uniref:asparagine synthase-related protein n=1 Tax=Kitasatospora purpeofusca TaxID=67352 RepID=UPI0035DDB020